MANKITKRDVINAMLANEVVSANETWVSYLKNELEILDKRKESKTQTANQKENIRLESVIADTLALSDKALTVTQIQEMNAELKALSNQKVSSIIRAMVEKKILVKTVEKRRSMFSLPKSEDENV